MKSGHFFQDLPRALPDEVIETLLAASALRIERIVSHGQHSPPGFWYDQDEHEWVMLLQGAARLRFADGDRSVDMLPGSHVLIAAHEKHRVEWTKPDEDSIWLAVFYRNGG
jgi:cupin 2 domain-containing protein